MSISRLKPYTSARIPLSQKKDELLKSIISSKRKLSPGKIDRPIILYGAGRLGRMATDFFKYVGQPVSYVVDIYANRQRADVFWKKTKVVYPQDVEQADREVSLLVVCIVTAPLIAMRDKLVAEGWKNIAFFYDMAQTYSSRHPMNNGWFLDALNKEDKKNIRSVFSSLEDDVSRAHYLQFLAWRRLRVELLSEEVSIQDDNRFFIPEVLTAMSNNEVFVDCGAHTGSVIEKFLKVTSGNYKKIYAIEPDKDNYKILKKEFGDTRDLKIITSALSKKEGERNFYQGFNFASKLTKRGNDSVKTVTLDSLAIPATFVKMHLEGGELDALKGALKTIRAHRPILAITTYHNSDGVWKTPLFLMKNLENYTYHMRLHAWAGAGMVVYAIPKEKGR